jgi:tRNA A37 methylthiotransferase MiaB
VTVAERARALRDVAAAHGRRFQSGLIGCSEDVLVLDTIDRATGRLVGLTGNYVEVTFAGPDHLRRRLARVRVTTIAGDAVHGVLQEAQAA